MDLSRATLNDIVEDFIKVKLGYGDKEFVVSNDVGILYDFDETDHLPKKLTDLGKFIGIVIEFFLTPVQVFKRIAF